MDTNTWLIRSIEIRIFFDLAYEWHTSGLLWTPWYTLLDWLHRIAKTLGTDPAMTISSVSWAQQATLRQHVLLIFGWKFPSNNQRISTAKTWGMLSHHDGLRPSWPLPDGRPGRSSERPFCFSWESFVVGARKPSLEEKEKAEKTFEVIENFGILSWLT